jgi:hypothetical protein
MRRDAGPGQVIRAETTDHGLGCQLIGQHASVESRGVTADRAPREAAINHNDSSQNVLFLDFRVLTMRL